MTDVIFNQCNQDFIVKIVQKNPNKTADISEEKHYKYQ